MSDTVIRVENLGKKYIIGHQANGHRTLRDVLADSLSAPFRLLRWMTNDRLLTDGGRWQTVFRRRSPVLGGGRSRQAYAIRLI